MRFTKHFCRYLWCISGKNSTKGNEHFEKNFEISIFTSIKWVYGKEKIIIINSGGAESWKKF